MNKVKYFVLMSVLAIVTSVSSYAVPDGFYSFNGAWQEDFSVLDTLGGDLPTGTNAAPAWTIHVAGPHDSQTQQILLPRARPDVPGEENWGGTNRGFNGGTLIGNDRALGVYRSAAGDAAHLTTRLQNDTGSAIQSVHLYFDVEVWFVRSTPRWGGWSLSYSFDGQDWHRAGDDFRASIQVESSSTTRTGWLDEPLAIRHIGGNLLLTEPWENGTPLFLRWNARDDLANPDSLGNGLKKNLGVFIDNIIMTASTEDVSPSGPGRETNTSFRESLAQSLPHREQVELLLDPQRTEAALLKHSTGNQPQVRTSASPISFVGIQFSVAAGLSGIRHFVEMSSSLNDTPWNEVAHFRNGHLELLEEEFGVDITTSDDGQQVVNVIASPAILDRLPQAFFRLRVIEE